MAQKYELIKRWFGLCLISQLPLISYHHMNWSSGPSRSDTNLPVQSQKQARTLKFRFYEEEELYYLCSENKGADQHRSYRFSQMMTEPVYSLISKPGEYSDQPCENNKDKTVLPCVNFFLRESRAVCLINPYITNGFTHHYHLGVHFLL